MALQSRRLNVYELYRIKWLVGALMAIVSVSSLFNLESHTHVPALISVIAITGCVLFPKSYAKAPPIIWKLFALSIIPLVSIDVLAKETVPALLNLNTWLILYRALNHAKRREEMQLVLLCLFLLVMAGMLTASLVFGLLLLFFAGLAIAFLSIGTLLENKAEGNSEEVSGTHAWDDDLGWLQLAKVIRYRNLAMGSAMFGSLLGIAAIAFQIIPRVNVEDRVNIFNMKSAASLTGFSENISLGEVTNIKNEKGVALRVDVEGEHFVPATPYWRMLALDAYRNGTFSLSTALKEAMAESTSSPYHAIRYWRERRFAESPSAIARDRWTFFMEPGVSKYLPSLGSFKQFTYTNLDDLSVGPQMHVFSLKETPSKMVSYQMEGVNFTADIPDVYDREYFEPLGQRARENGRLSEAVYPDTLLELPDDSVDRAYLKLVADEISGGSKLSPVEFASRATEYLDDTHDYSLSVNLPKVSDIKDPVVRWIRSGSDGHCEFFASSLILLLRTAGYRARAVVGFKGGAWNTFEKYYMVRNSDAHAWCEVYDGKGSWVRVDPTPGSGLPTTPELTVQIDSQAGESTSLAYVDSLRMLWYRRVVNFDEQAQKAAAVQLRDFFLAYIQVAEEWSTRAAMQIYAWIVAPWSMTKFYYTSSSLIIAVSALLFQRNLALNYRELILAPFKRGDPIRRKASKLLRRAEQKRPKAKSIPEKREAVIANLNRLRFGRKETWANPRIVFKEARRWL